MAAGIVPFAHASDGVGSIRAPASVCGLFGFMPSRGRCVPASLPSGFGALVRDHCISRTVRDSALLLALTEDHEGTLPPVGHVRDAAGPRLRIAAWSRTLVGDEPEAEVLRAHSEAAALCRALGHRVDPVASPDLDGAPLGRAILAVLGATVVRLVEAVDAARECPVQRDELEPFTWAAAEAFLRQGDGALTEARAVLAEAAARYLAALRGYGAVLTPTLAIRPWRIGHLPPPPFRWRSSPRAPGAPSGRLLSRTRRAAPRCRYRFTGRPRACPSACSSPAVPGADALLLRLAYELEEARPWRDRWAPHSYPRLFEWR